MSIMKRLLSVLLILAMLLSFAACDDKKKNNDDEDEDEDEEETANVNNDFAGTYEGEIDLLNVYCVTFENAADDDVLSYGEGLEGKYTATMVIALKDDTADMSFEFEEKDVEKFVEKFYRNMAEDMFEDEDELEEAMEDAEDAIQDDIDAMIEFLESTDEDLAYESDEESELILGDLELEIEAGKKKFTVVSVDDDDFDVMLKDVTFKKVKNFKDSNKKDDESEEDDKDNEDEDEDEDDKRPSNRPSRPSIDNNENKEESADDPIDEPVEIPDDVNFPAGRYTAEINLANVFSAMYDCDESVLEYAGYMSETITTEATIEVKGNTISLSFTGNVDSDSKTFVEGLYGALAEQQGLSASDFASDIEYDTEKLAAYLNDFYFTNATYTYDSDWESMVIDLGSVKVVFNFYVYDDYFIIASITNESSEYLPVYQLIFDDVTFSK